MNIQASPSAGVPVVNQALEPTWVRNGSASTQKAYQAALSFEQTLVEQLAHSLTATSGLGGESQEGEAGAEEGGSGSSMAGASQLSSMLPQALASGVMNAGGLGLAAELTKGLQSAQGAAPQQAGGGADLPSTPGGGSQTNAVSPVLASAQTSSGAAVDATGGASSADTGGTSA
jgi:Rod binding domain-containing protein